MAAAGMESVIIKVAGAGLGVKHLGQNVCSKAMREELALMVIQDSASPKNAMC